MPDPNIVDYFGSKLNELKSSITTNRENTATKSTASGILGYPKDILGVNSDVNRAVQFSAYEYIWGSTVRNQEVQTKEFNKHLFSCYLPIPPISETDIHDYPSFDAFGTGQIKNEDIRSVANNVMGAINADSLGAAASAAGKAFESAGNIAKPVLVKGAYNIIKGALGGDWNVLRRNAFNGVTVNPLTTVIYENTKLREFSFSYNMIAQDAYETAIIDSIIKRFKFHGRPSKSKMNTGKDSPIDLSLDTLTHPSVWKINFVGYGTESSSEISNWLPKIKTCVLTSVRVSYTGGEDGRPIFFRSTGAPVQYSLDLTFKEIYMNTAEEVFGDA